MMTKYNEFFSGHQLCQVVECRKHRRFEHQPPDMANSPRIHFKQIYENIRCRSEWSRDLGSEWSWTIQHFVFKSRSRYKRMTEFLMFSTFVEIRYLSLSNRDT